MKKAVAFLLAFFIFVAPMTTLVKADVVIGDNYETIINENATILGRKLALMESLSDLALSGVTEFSISNATDVDSYLDSLWSEVNDALESLTDGTGFTDISNTLKSKYFTNLVQYQDYINNRGDYFATMLQNPATSLLSTYFADNIIGKQDFLQSNTSLNAFRALSQRGASTPTPTPDNNYAGYLNNINGSGFFWSNYTNKQYYSPSYRAIVYTPYSYYSWITNESIPYSQNFSIQFHIAYYDIQSIYITSVDGVYYINHTLPSSINGFYAYETYNTTFDTGAIYPNNGGFDGGSFNTKLNRISVSGTLENCLKYLQQHCRNINIYVDGVLWTYVGGDNSSSPTLDIDGLLKIYGNDNTPQYQLQPNTKIDYEQLYQVIYNAIRDNLPISQGDINYYDSHDTIYSPTIINNYGEEEGNESDLIDTILDYAVIPKFDTSIAQPMRSALTNGVLIMQNSITNVIPEEILFILGACFFLLLFAVVINRMLE